MGLILRSGVVIILSKIMLSISIMMTERHSNEWHSDEWHSYVWHSNGSHSEKWHSVECGHSNVYNYDE